MDAPLPDDFDPYRGDMRISNDAAGFTLFFQWLLGVAAVIVSTTLIVGATSLIGVREDVAILKDRPLPVTKAEFDVRMESFERRLRVLEAK